MDFLSGNFCLTVFESNMDMIGYIAAIFEYLVIKHCSLDFVLHN